MSKGMKPNPMGKALLTAGLIVFLISNAASAGDQRRILSRERESSLIQRIFQKKIRVKGHILKEGMILSAALIPSVPAYLWRHGSAPTAAAMLLGFYDLQGYSELLPGLASTQTDEINLAIASTAHYDEYALPLDTADAILPDKSELPESEQHNPNCLADYLNTSKSGYGNYYGSTRKADVSPGIEEYVAVGGLYTATVTAYSFQNITWATIQNEIRNGRPLIFLVDPDGDGNADHFVTVIGTVVEDDIPYYACYNTLDGEVHWYNFRYVYPGYEWGFYAVYTVSLHHRVFPPLEAEVERLVSNLIFSKEYINRLTWTENAANASRVVGYKIYRKSSSETDAYYTLIGTTDASVFTYGRPGIVEERDLFLQARRGGRGRTRERSDRPPGQGELKGHRVPTDLTIGACRFKVYLLFKRQEGP